MAFTTHKNYVPDFVNLKTTVNDNSLHCITFNESIHLGLTFGINMSKI